MPNGVKPAALSFLASARNSRPGLRPLVRVEAGLLEHRLVPHERDAEQVLRHRPELAARHVLLGADPVLRLAGGHVVGDRHGPAVPGRRQHRQRRPLRGDVGPALGLGRGREGRDQRVGALQGRRDLDLRVRLLVDGDLLLDPVVRAGRVVLAPVPVGQVRVVRIVRACACCWRRKAARREHGRAERQRRPEHCQHVLPRHRASVFRSESLDEGLTLAEPRQWTLSSRALAAAPRAAPGRRRR